MTDTVSEARQLRAQGVPIPLLDGRTVRLIFDAEALAAIEDDFGSLGAMQDALAEMATDPQRAKYVRPLLRIMRPALMHDKSAADALFDMAEFQTYYDSVIEAMELSFPKEKKAETSDVPAEIVDMPDFPGQTSTTSQRSDSDVLTPLSGG